MFNEVDTNGDKEVSQDEWLGFWKNVLSQKGDDGKALYSAEDVMEEIDSMLTGGSWVDWLDGRST